MRIWGSVFFILSSLAKPPWKPCINTCNTKSLRELSYSLTTVFDIKGQNLGELKETLRRSCGLPTFRSSGWRHNAVSTSEMTSSLLSLGCFYHLKVFLNNEKTKREVSKWMRPEWIARHATWKTPSSMVLLWVLFVSLFSCFPQLVTCQFVQGPVHSLRMYVWGSSIGFHTIS